MSTRADDSLEWSDGCAVATETVLHADGEPVASFATRTPQTKSSTARMLAGIARRERGMFRRLPQIGGNVHNVIIQAAVSTGQASRVFIAIAMHSVDNSTRGLSLRRSSGECERTGRRFRTDGLSTLVSKYFIR